MAFDLDPAYKQVPERIADLKATHPDARLRPTDPLRPYWLEEIDGATFVVYSAACYLTPDDPLPGIGIAWEPFPGRTPYTKDSELMNAETSAWGRAIVAALQSESKAIASAEEVRNRAAEHAEGPRERTYSGGNPPRGRALKPITTGEDGKGGQLKFITDLFSRTGLDAFALKDIVGRDVVTPTDMTFDEAKAAIDYLIKVRDGKIDKPAQPERRTTAEAAPADPPVGILPASEPFPPEPLFDESDEPF